MAFMDHIHVAKPILKTLRDAGCRVTLVGYNSIQFFPIEDIHKLGLEFLTISDRGPESIPLLSKKQYIKLCGNDIDFPRCMIQEYFANHYPLNDEYLFQDSLYYQRYYGIAYRLEQIIKSCSPDFVVFQQGSENISKLIYVKSIKCGIPALVWESPFFTGKMTLDSEGMHFFPGQNLIDKKWHEIRDKELSTKEKDRLKQFLNNWRSQKQSKHEQLTDNSELISISKIKASGTRVLFFPGQVPWDANVLTSLRKFNCYDEIVKYLKKYLPESWIIVHKVHPKNTANKLKIGWFGHNCFVVKNVNIHALIPIADACCVLSSNVGMEALMYNKPVICLGRPHYSWKGLTLDWERKEDLPRLLQETLTFKHEKKLLERFLNYVIYDYLIDEGDTTSLLRRLNQAQVNTTAPLHNAAPFTASFPDKMSSYLALIAHYDQSTSHNFAYEENLSTLCHIKARLGLRVLTPWLKKILFRLKPSSRKK